MKLIKKKKKLQVIENKNKKKLTIINKTKINSDNSN